MPREYTVEFENDATTTGDDLFELDAAAEKPIEIYGLFLSQTSEVGDAQDEMLRYRVIRGHTTSGSGGTTTTPCPLDDGDPAAGFAAEVCNTAIASAGTAVNLHSGAFNVRAGEPLWLPEDAGWWSRGSSLLVVRLMGAPADSINLSGTLYVREH